MTVRDILNTRVSLHQKYMTGGEVLRSDLQEALQAASSVPVHGRECPYHYVVFSKDSIKQAKDIVYMVKAAKHSREFFDENHKGVGAIIFAFCRKLSGKIPTYEHEWSTACGVYAIELALFNAGYATKWNSVYKDSPHVASILDACGLDDGYTPMGYVVVGTGVLEKKSRLDSSAYSTWK